jgi:NSS family neurotransmitter:Na+ symporter
MSIIGLLLGLIYVTAGGIDWLGTIDGFINGTWGIAFLGFLECVVLGWFYRIEKLRAHANERSDWKIGTWFNHAIRVFIPIALGTLVIWNLFDDFSKEGGFLRSPDGTWLIHNCVGISVMAVVPVIAIILSLIKSPIPVADTHGLQSELQYHPSRSGRMAGAIAFILALASAAIIAIVLQGRNDTSLIRQPLLYITFALAVLALSIANNILRKLDTSAILPSTFARWAGIIALLDISVSIAMVLIHLGENVSHIEPPPRETDSLSTVSYIILAVVAFLIIGGLAWCFYRAITVSANSPESDTNS